jgi:hypothetical protein
MEVDMVVPTTMDVDAIRKCKSLCRASMICIKAGQPANIAWDRSIFDFLPAPSDFNEPGVSSSASGSNPKASEKPASTGSNLSQVSISPVWKCGVTYSRHFPFSLVSHAVRFL